MNTTSHIENIASATIREMAASEHRYLMSCSKQDGFTLSDIECSENSDEGFQSWFHLSTQDIVITFTYALGYNADQQDYQPYASATCSRPDDEEPTEFRHYATDAVDDSELPDAVAQLARECGEVRAEAFQWLDSSLASMS